MIILSVCPVPDKRHLMTKMSSTLRRSENCRRGRKAEFPLRVLLVTFIARSSQLFAHPLARRRLHWTLLNTRSSPHCIALQQISTRLDSKMLNYLLFVANISQEEVVTSFYLHSCYVVAGQASMHLRFVVFAICVCVCVFAKHRRDSTNDMAVQVRTLHSGRAAGCHLISFSRPAQSKFEVQPPPEHHFVEQHTHYCSVTQECGPCSACSAYGELHTATNVLQFA